MIAAGEREAVVRHLVARGLTEDGEPLAVESLPGGVSSEVIAVSVGSRELVVKRALPRLRVEQEWRADVARVAIEGRALAVAGALAPGAVPPVRDLDEQAHVLVMERAPRGWTDWRDDLLAGRIEPDVGRRLGGLLARWHRGTATDAETRAQFADTTVFEQLRIDPFHRTVAGRHPDLRPRIAAVVNDLLENKACLVHGDFSPKNVLVAPAGDELWVLDWEVAHVGDPRFDVAFMLSHLLLKAVHRPGDAPAYGSTAAAFLDGYGRVVSGAGEPVTLAEQLGCLLLARVDGKSPAGYLTIEERDRVRELGRSLLTARGADILALWDASA